MYNVGGGTVSGTDKKSMQKPKGHSNRSSVEEDNMEGVKMVELVHRHNLERVRVMLRLGGNWKFWLMLE